MPILKSYLKQIENYSIAKKKSLILLKEELFSFLESDTVTHGYIDQSKCNKMNIINFLVSKESNQGKQLKDGHNTVSKVVNINNCSNIIINL